MKKHFLQLIFICLVCLSIQTLHGQNVFELKGYVTNDQGTPLSYATVSILTPDTTQILYGDITAENGQFRIANIPKQRYTVKVQFIGHTPDTRIILLDKNTDLGHITLKEEAHTLEGVNVVANRIKQTGEGFLVNLTNNPWSKGLDMEGTLSMLPGLNMFNNKLTINGRGGVVVFINGNKATEEELQALDPALVKNVEIIPMGGAEYQASGSGVIKVELVKPREDGGIWSFRNRTVIDRLGLRYESLYAQVQYRYKRWGLYYSGIYTPYGNFRSSDKQETTSYNDGSILEGSVYGRNRTRYRLSNKLTAEYNFNKQHQIRGMIFLLSDADSLFKSSHNRLIQQTEPDSYSRLDQKRRSKLNTINSTLSYIWNFGKSNSWTTELLYKFTHNSENMGATYYSPEISYQDREDNDYKIKLYSFYSRLNIALGKGSLNARLQYDYVDSPNDFAYLSNRTGAWQPLNGYGANYVQKQTVFMLYLNYMCWLTKRFWFKAEVTYKDPTFKYHSTEPEYTVKQNYAGFYPGFSLFYNLNDKAERNLRLGFNKILSYPNLGYFSPFRTYYSETQYSVGNPDIKCDTHYITELTYNHNSHLSLTYSLYTVKDLIEVVSFTEENNPHISYTKPVNLGTKYEHRLMADYNTYIASRHRLKLSAYVEYEDAHLSEYSFQQFRYYLQAYYLHRFGKGWTGTATLNYKSKIKMADYSYSDSYGLDASLSKSFLKNKLTVTGYVYSLFSPKPIIDTHTASFERHSVNNRPRQSITLRLAYRFNTGKKIREVRDINTSEFTKDKVTQ